MRGPRINLLPFAKEPVVLMEDLPRVLGNKGVLFNVRSGEQPFPLPAGAPKFYVGVGVFGVHSVMAVRG